MFSAHEGLAHSEFLEVLCEYRQVCTPWGRQLMVPIEPRVDRMRHGESFGKSKATLAVEPMIPLHANAYPHDARSQKHLSRDQDIVKAKREKVGLTRMILSNSSRLTSPSPSLSASSIISCI